MELYCKKVLVLYRRFIRIWTLHRIISTASSCSSSSRFALSQTLVVGYFVSRTVLECAGSLWGWCGSPGVEDFLLSIDFGWALPEFHLICKTSTEVIPLCVRTVLLAVENRGICIYRCVTLQLAFPLSVGDWWQIRWTGVFSATTVLLQYSVSVGTFGQLAHIYSLTAKEKDDSSDS